MSFQNYSCNDNQNYFVQGGRPTSRVLAPPGGQSSLTLGVLPAAHKKPSVVKVTEEVAKEDVSPQPSVSTAPLEKTVAEPPVSAAMLPSMQQQQQAVSANAFASGARMNGANVMTGRPTSRVLAPPGGFSSIQLG